MLTRKPKIVAIVPSYIASCQIGVIKPLSALARANAIQLAVELETKASLNAVHAADLVVFCRNTEPSYAHLLNQAVSTNKPIIYDLDDNFWDIPFETDPELARYHRLPLRIQQLEKYLTHASLVRVYSPVMRDLVWRFNKRVRVLRAGFDFSLLPKHARHSADRQKVQIVYATSRTVDNQYKLFLDPILRIIEHFGNAIQFTIWGCKPGDLVGHRGVTVLPLFGNYEEFLRRFARSGFDIGLAPLENTPFHRSKTNTKFRDYGACRVAGVYSNTEVYSSCVDHEKTGILVNNNPQSWFDGIAKLVENPQLRQNIQAQAYDAVFKEYRQQVVEDEWLTEIKEILASDTTYSLASSPLRQVQEVLVRPDLANFSGFNFPACSPGDQFPVGKVFLEVLTPDRNVLREASSTHQSKGDGETARFIFNPIRNSKGQEFLLRFISVPETMSDKSIERWLPTSAFIQMLYAPPQEGKQLEEITPGVLTG